eukprot:scaffold67560_cov31-Tisochrysis_lutea.AAC.5
MPVPIGCSSAWRALIARGRLDGGSTRGQRGRGGRCRRRRADRRMRRHLTLLSQLPPPGAHLVEPWRFPLRSATPRECGGGKEECGSGEDQREQKQPLHRKLQWDRERRERDRARSKSSVSHAAHAQLRRSHRTFCDSLPGNGAMCKS